MSAAAGAPEGFSLLLPVYGGDDADFLTRAFDSAVLRQTLRPSEVVLVQDGPIGDGLRTAIEAAAANGAVPVTVVELPRNEGLAVALTRGLEACSFDIVARMDADDIAVPERFAVQIPLVRQGLDLVGSALHEFRVADDGSEQIVGRRVPPLSEHEIRRYLPFHDPFNHPTVVYRREAVRRAGGYQPMGMMEDYWLFARMVLDGARVANVEEPLVKYRVSAGAYARRGGWALLRSELALQRAFRSVRLTSRRQLVRNVVMRGGYRLLPEAIRKGLYRRVVHPDFHDV